MQRLAAASAAMFALSACLAPPSFAQDAPGQAPPPKKQSCVRPLPGAVIQAPPDLYSSNGVLNVSLNFVTSLDANNLTLFCYVTPDGLESPTLHVKPGDTLNITLKNTLPKMPRNAKFEPMIEANERCGAKSMESGSINIHFHGMNVSPTCHSDEVVHTLVNPGQTFTYSIAVPADEPPGMYWYHPHVHGFADVDLLGGASGAIEVEGIENIQPRVAKLPALSLIIRDQMLVPQNAQSPDAQAAGVKTPSWDMSLNYVPNVFPTQVPAILQVQHGQKQFWRVVNASSDTIADLELKFDGKPQQVDIVALDGVAVGSQDGTHHGKLLPVSDVYIPPSGRAEFIIPPIPHNIRKVTLETKRINTGPKGDTDTHRVLAVIQEPADSMPAMASMPAVSGPPGPQRFAGLDNAAVSKVRHLVFSEIFPDPQDPNEGLFYITVAGHVPQLFDPNAKPAITTTQGAVEDWIIENQTNEVHEFHIHQIHFQVRDINGVPVPSTQRQFRDTFEVPYWTGKGPYPSVRLRMDFRGAVVGDFVYHCHILDHEDNGMMAIVRVNAAK